MVFVNRFVLPKQQVSATFFVPLFTKSGLCLSSGFCFSAYTGQASGLNLTKKMCWVRIKDWTFNRRKENKKCFI